MCAAQVDSYVASVKLQIADRICVRSASAQTAAGLFSQRHFPTARAVALFSTMPLNEIEGGFNAASQFDDSLPSGAWGSVPEMLPLFLSQPQGPPGDFFSPQKAVAAPAFPVTSESANVAQSFAGLQAPRRASFSFIDETKQFSDQEERARALSETQARNLEQTGSSMLCVQPYLSGHPMIQTEFERTLVWEMLSHGMGSSQERLVEALSKRDFAVFDRLLREAIKQILEQRDQHLSFWIDFFTRDFRSRIQQELADNPSFMAVSMRGFDPSSEEAAALLQAP